MEIVAYGRSCAEATFGTPSCHLFNTSHLGTPRFGVVGPAANPALTHPLRHDWGRPKGEAPK
jgi:hypothetical protein